MEVVGWEGHRRSWWPSLVVGAGLTLVAVQGAAAAPFAVNTYSTAEQSNPVVAVTAGSDFVVVWESEGQDGDDLGVFARAFDSAGGAAGVELQVNETYLYSQSSPAVAPAAGGFVVVWEEYDPFSSAGDRIEARRFDGQMRALGGEFRVDTALSDYHVAPAVSADHGGTFVVAWDDYSDVFGQLVSVAGELVGPEFRVNAASSGYQALAAVARLTDGGFVVAWTDGSYYGGRDGDGYGIFARRFSSSGAPLGDDFQVNPGGTGDQLAPVVAANADGGFVVAWESYDLLEESGRVEALRFDPTGAPVGMELRVSDELASFPETVAAAIAASGELAVVWSDLQPSAYRGVVARRFDSTGLPSEDPLAVDPNSAVDQTSPAVAYLTDGRFVVTWQADGADGDGGSIVAAIAGAPFPTATVTFAATATPTAVPNATATPSQTPVPSSSSTPTGSATPSASSTSTRSATPSASSTATRSATPSASSTPAHSATPGASSTQTPSATRTRTATLTPTATSAFSATPASTVTPTTAMSAPTMTRTVTQMATHTATGTRTATATGTAPATSTAASTPTGISTPTPTETFTSAATATGTATQTVTGTRTPTGVADATASPTAVASATTAATIVMDQSPTATRTDTPDAAGTRSPTPAATATSSPDRTASVGTPTFTAIPTATPSIVNGATATAGVTATVVPASPSATLTSSPVNSTATPPAGVTETPATATIAPSQPTSTVGTAATVTPTVRPTAATCSGDCDVDGRVSVSELVVAVNVALGRQPGDRCAAADRDGDGEVRISELIQAVNRALDGCR